MTDEWKWHQHAHDGFSYDHNHEGGKRDHLHKDGARWRGWWRFNVSPGANENLLAREHHPLP
jgi:hypothetical protein